MGISYIQFCSESEAVKIAPDQTMAIISITNPGETAQIQEGFGDVLRIQFADAQYDELTIKFFDSMWESSSKGFVTKYHAKEIISFLDNLSPNVTKLIVHCGAGVSRSVAVAQYAAIKFGVKLHGSLGGRNITVSRLLDNPELFDEFLPKVSYKAPFYKKIINALISR